MNWQIVLLALFLLAYLVGGVKLTLGTLRTLDGRGSLTMGEAILSTLLSPGLFYLELTHIASGYAPTLASLALVVSVVGAIFFYAWELWAPSIALVLLVVIPLYIVSE